MKSPLSAILTAFLTPLLFIHSTSALSTNNNSNAPFKFQRIDHIVLRCHNFGSMFHFYTTILGCTIDHPNDIERFGGALTHLRAGDSYIDLVSYDLGHLSGEGVEAVARMHAGGQGIGIAANLLNTPAKEEESIAANSKLLSNVNFDASTSTLDHLCLRIDPFDEESIRKYLDEHGVPVLSTGLRKGAEGVGPSVYIADPEGNIIELKGPSSQSEAGCAQD